MVLVVKNLPANAGDIRDEGSVTGRSPGGAHGNPLQYSCLENPMDRRAGGATVHEVTKSWVQLKIRLGILGLTHDYYHIFELKKYSGVCLGSNYLCLNLALSRLFAK